MALFVNHIFTLLTGQNYASIGRENLLGPFDLVFSWTIGAAKVAVDSWVACQGAQMGITWYEHKRVAQSLLQSTGFEIILTPLVMTRAEQFFNDNLDRPSEFWRLLSDLVVDLLEGSKSIYDYWPKFMSGSEQSYTGAFKDEFITIRRGLDPKLSTHAGSIEPESANRALVRSGKAATSGITVTPGTGFNRNPYAGRSSTRVNATSESDFSLADILQRLSPEKHASQEEVDSCATHPCIYHCAKALENPELNISPEQLRERMHTNEACLNANNPYIRCSLIGFENVMKRLKLRRDERKDCWTKQKLELDAIMEKRGDRLINIIMEHDEMSIRIYDPNGDIYTIREHEDRSCF